jgi:hypothetical protein
MIPSNTFHFDTYHYEVVEEKIPTGFLWLAEKTVYAIRRIPKRTLKDEKCCKLYISYSKVDGKYLYSFDPLYKSIFEVLYFDTPEEAKSVLETARENKVEQEYKRSSDAIYSTQDDEVSLRGMK